MAKNIGSSFESKRFVSIHFWTIVLSTMELYGGFMTFVPEWLTGSTQLRTGKPHEFDSCSTLSLKDTQIFRRQLLALLGLSIPHEHHVSDPYLLIVSH